MLRVEVKSSTRSVRDMSSVPYLVPGSSGGERRERRTKDCGMITRFQSLRVTPTPTPQPKMEEEEEGRIERGALHCWISRAAGFPFSMNIYSVARKLVELF